MSGAHRLAIMNQPNILLVIADGMQAGAVEPNHPCLTPNLTSLADRGVRFKNAHTTCPTCSPARASLMTGLLPHNHGVLEVEHGRDEDQSVLRTQYPHFAQQLSDAGYSTGYFGKWHIERTNEVANFGWQESVVKGAEHVKGLGRGDRGPQSLQIDEALRGEVSGPKGYRTVLHWGVTDTPLLERYPGTTVLDAEDYLQKATTEQSPWCCCVSFSEPNEALVVGRETWDQYAEIDIPLPVNFQDDLSDRPNFYQRQRKIGANLSDEHWKAARRCYFGRITEIDSLLPRLLAPIEKAGQLENTVVVFLADHGRYVGGHGFDAHNFGAFEEIYRIPLIVAGPEVASGKTCEAFVSIGDVGVTLNDLGQAESMNSTDSNSFKSLLHSPDDILESFQTGYAEYHGTRFPLMQRILWEGPWKFVFNGFDFDELYNLDDDPYEMQNLINEETQQDHIQKMMAKLWKRVRETGDRAILESHYFSMRFAAVGPDASVE
ncbi:Choline-sulfatase [Thalassoglobus polymorphus]|uniref:Choline-sulfatase n=2 Tax=Thalassoglobus polymorphus TaxID=2527994 RepID=A0A517QSV7_9PLAN|nr:Choline-sulfatase [Thalassoglobus polymorphus]